MRDDPLIRFVNQSEKSVFDKIIELNAAQAEYCKANEKLGILSLKDAKNSDELHKLLVKDFASHYLKSKNFFS